MTYPTINMNGTSADSLLAGLCDAMGAIREAQAKLQTTQPNGRDYYVQGSTALQLAQFEHTHRHSRRRSSARKCWRCSRQMSLKL